MEVAAEVWAKEKRLPRNRIIISNLIFIGYFSNKEVF
jgi:hypothetical protein